MKLSGRLLDRRELVKSAGDEDMGELLSMRSLTLNIFLR